MGPPYVTDQDMYSRRQFLGLNLIFFVLRIRVALERFGGDIARGCELGIKELPDPFPAILCRR